MKPLNRADLERSLNEGKIQPLYLLLGPERYLRDAAARAITNAALAGTLLREFNEASFSLLSDDVQTAIAAAEQLPMMSDHRVIRIRDFSRLREAQEDVLIAYVANPVPSTVVVFIADELDKRKKATKSLLDRCTVVDFSPLKDAEARAWVNARLKELKTAADDQVISELVRLVGTNVQTLFMEVDKLASGAADTGRITRELVEELIGRSRELANWELTDHLLAGNRKKALETLHRLLEDEVEPLMLLGLIGSNYRKLALGKQVLMQKGQSEVFKHVFIQPFKQRSYLETLRRTDAAKLSHAIQLIANVDLAIKTSQATPRLQMEMLVCELAG
ncbi:MAG TPA: DNA polymerase III subunit delta [Pyrinomonadaceae bacterium]|nr:DNA polymerase III subunit delta [Pyrinomonadaceae bacterium]